MASMPPATTPAMCLRRTCEPGAARVTGETFVSTVSSREACIDAVAAAPTATCPEPKIANMLADFPSGNSPCYCQTGTDTTPGPVCAPAAAARRLPALRWPCCLVCACVLGSVPRLLPDALAPSVSPRTPPACVQILPHSTPAASSPSREAPRLLRLFFRAIWAKRVRNWAIARTVRLESTNLWLATWRARLANLTQPPPPTRAPPKPIASAMLDTRAPTAAHAPRATQGNTGSPAGIQGAVTAPTIRCRRQLALRILIASAMPDIRAPTAPHAPCARQENTRWSSGVQCAVTVPPIRCRRRAAQLGQAASALPATWAPTVPHAPRAPAFTGK